MKLILLLLLVPSALIFCQKEEGLEEMYETTVDESGKNEAAFADVERLAENPLSLRNANPEELSLLPGFTYSLSSAIIEYSRKNPFLSLDDIASFFSLDPNQKLLLTYCVSLDEKYNPEKFSFFYRARNRQKFQEIKGFRNGKYLGSPFDFYQKIDVKKGAFSSGIIIDKDAGEKYLNDFVSGFAEFKTNYFKIIGGDFNVETGLGSILWKSFGLRKSSETIYPINERASGITSNHSTLDFSYFRGLACEGKIPITTNSKFRISGWCSYTSRGATINDSGVATSVSADYFRTESEITKKGTLLEKTGGMDLEMNYSSFYIGSSLLFLYYDKEIRSKSSTAFIGKQGFLKSIYASFDKTNYYLSAEAASDALWNVAAKGNAVVKYDSLKLAGGFRYFSKDFRSPFGYIFGESSSPTNETGVYLAIDDMISFKSRIRSYIDVFANKNTSLEGDAYYKGFEALIQYDYKFNFNTDFIFKLVYEQKKDASKFGEELRMFFTRTKINLRAELATHPYEKLRLRGRFEFIRVNYSGYISDELGYAAFADAKWQILENLSFNARFSYFNTPSYTSAIWQYEYSMPGLMRSLGLYGSGYRTLIGIEYKPIETISLYGRYSILVKNGVDKLYSGNEEIEGNFDNRLEIQLEFRL